MSEDSCRYNDIINLPHHRSSVHPCMPIRERAAQFSPFAALTGYDEAILETARITENGFELDESRQEKLSNCLALIKEHIKESPEVKLCYFKPDDKKTGGKYITVSGVVKKIDDYEHKIVMKDGAIIPMEDLYDLDGELFEPYNF